MKITEIVTVTEISVAVIALAFVMLVIFLIITSIKAKKAFESTQVDLHKVSLEISNLISQVNGLTADIQTKTDILFDTISSFKPTTNTADSSENEHPVKAQTSLTLIGWVLSSLLLAKKTKNFMKKIW